MAILDGETGKGRVDLYHDRIEQNIDQSANRAGLAKRHTKHGNRRRPRYQRIQTRANPIQTTQRKGGGMNDIIRNSGQQMLNENAGQTRRKNEPDGENRVNNGKAGRNKKRKNWHMANSALINNGSKNRRHRAGK